MYRTFTIRPDWITLSIRLFGFWRGAALRRQAELASPGLDRCPMKCWTPPESEEPLFL